MVTPAWGPPDEFEEYRLVRLLGFGAMGQVYLARDLLLDRPVAVKFVHAATDPAARARVIEEARAIARLQHPNVVAVYRVAEVEGHPYLVSEYVRGRALDRLERPLPWRQVLEIALDLTRGLAAAHRRGVLHRDVKPANAILTEEGRAKLLDFGLARIMDERGAGDPAATPPLAHTSHRDRGRSALTAIEASPVVRSHTMSALDSTILAPIVDGRGAGIDPVPAALGAGVGAARSPSHASIAITSPRSASRPRGVGTPLYMAPEVWRGEAATRRSDLYSLGILLYELLTGMAPHHGISMAELACAVQSRDIPRLGDIAPSVEPALAAIVDRLVARDADARFASADALLAALEERAFPTAVNGTPDGNPYRGLAAFESLHGPLFFGRRREVHELVDALGGLERMGRARDLLWGRRQLAEAKALDQDSLAPRELAFLASAATALVRRRLVGAIGAVVLLIGAILVGPAIRAKVRRELDAVVADQLHAAMTAQEAARQIATQRDVAQSRALGLFDAHRWSEGERAWTEAQAMAAREDSQYRSASGHLESILLLDPAHAGLRDWLADLTFERLVRAERDRHRDLADELAARMVAYDDGRYQAALDAKARVELEVVPAGTRVWSERPGAPRELLGQAPLPALALPPGSLVLSFEAPGHVAARLPVLLSRGQTLGLRVVLPAAASAPPGMVYVPPGRFLFGSADNSDLRRGFLRAAPLHEVSTGGYFIGRHEVTFAEWIEFLDDLAPDERRRRSPSSVSTQASLTLTELGPRRWRLALTPTTRTYTAETGQRLHYEGRTRRADQDWTKFPVSAISYDDALAFAAWLDRTRRIPGARLCNEYEWERAARGADARTFPSGESLAPDDANIDVTYGRAPLAFGPDEVGSHPGSRSPVGADDMAGNVGEWTSSVQTSGAPITRGGCWYEGDLTARSMNRTHTEPTQRHPLIGVRLCVTPR